MINRTLLVINLNSFLVSLSTAADIVIVIIGRRVFVCFMDRFLNKLNFFYWLKVKIFSLETNWASYTSRNLFCLIPNTLT